MPSGFADNILSDHPDETLFLRQTRPVFNRDFPIHAQKGIYGIRVDAGHGITIRNCSIMEMENVGKPGATLDDIPSGSYYKPATKYTAGPASFNPGRFMGNDIYGIALIACDNSTISNCDISSFTSTNGFVYGICLMNQSEANSIESCKVTGLRGLRDDIESLVNPSSKVFGYYCVNDSHSNHMHDCITKNLQSTRLTYGMYIENCRDILISNAVCSNNSALADQTINAPKRACGIASIGNHGMAIRNSIVREMTCANETNVATSASQAIGYLFDASLINTDQFGVIDNAIAECNNGGKGLAAGVYIDKVDNFSATNNTLAYNKSGSGKGYGIFKAPKASNLIVMRNTAFGNNKNYASGSDTWPILPLTSSSVHSPNVYNPWYNISIAN
jgi:hypothetical protein